MPLPLIFILPSLAGAMIGVGENIKVSRDIIDSNETNKEANSIVENAKNNLELHKSADKEFWYCRGVRPNAFLNFLIMWNGLIPASFNISSIK